MNRRELVSKAMNVTDAIGVAEEINALGHNLKE